MFLYKIIFERSEKIYLHFAEGKLSFRRRCTALTIFRRKMEAEADKAESKFAAGKYIITRAKRDLSQLSPIKPEEVLFRHSAAVVGLVLFLKEIGKTADPARVVCAAGDVKSALAAECVISNTLLGQN